MSSIRTKILIRIAMAIFLVEALILVVGIGAAKRRLMDDEEGVLNSTAEMAKVMSVTSAIQTTDEQFGKFISQLEKVQGVHLLVMDPAGRPWTTHVVCALPGGCRAPEELRQAIEFPDMNFIQTRANTQSAYLHCVYPIHFEAGGKSFERLLVSRDISGIPSKLWGFGIRLFGVILPVAICTILVVYLGLRRIVLKPIQRILQADEAEMKGDVGVSAISPEEMPGDEFGTIMKTRAALLAKLKSAYGELEGINQSLEARVEERTRELQTAMDKLKRTQNQLIQSAKLAAMGELSAGICHELSNPLTGILCLAGVVQQGKQDRNEIARMFKMIEDEAKRMQTIVSNLRGFSRKATPPHPILLTLAVQKACDIMRRVVEKRGVEVVITANGDLPPVMGDENLVQQVVVNLLSNAADAFDGITDNRKRAVAIHARRQDKFVEVIVKDNGVGIPPDVLEHIFDAFYTTKPLEKGTGLGLSITRQIVKDMDGDIHVRSTPGAGTEFTIIFKIAETMPASG